jgi:AcrR family transcriptional regulator
LSDDARGAARESRRLARAVERGRHPGEPDTRGRIQRVAIELFTERGYEATSLREIAEQLGVTKAALYYHFRTKDDIIDSLVDDRMARVQELIDWAQDQPRSVETKREVVRRYSTVLNDPGNYDLMRFFERNHASMNQHKAGMTMRERMLQLLEVLVDRDTPLPDQIRSSLAIMALHSAFFGMRDSPASDEERQEAALEVALDLIERSSTARPDEDDRPGR